MKKGGCMPKILSLATWVDLMSSCNRYENLTCNIWLILLAGKFGCTFNVFLVSYTRRK